jgi:hypothetical protein
VSGKSQPCHYCGWPVAKVRHPGDPPTCHGCRDLPAQERRLDAELEHELERFYNGEA